MDTLALAAAADGGGSSFDPLYFDPSAFLLTIIFFFGLLFALRKIAWGPMLEAAEKREKRIEEAIAAAEKQRREADGLLEDYKRRVANVEQEVAQLRDKGRADAEEMRRQTLDKARGEADALVERAKREIDSSRLQALEDIRREAVTLGLSVAGRVVERSLDGDDHKRLAEQVLAEVGAVEG